MNEIDISTTSPERCGGLQHKTFCTIWTKPPTHIQYECARQALVRDGKMFLAWAQQGTPTPALPPKMPTPNKQVLTPVLDKLDKLAELCQDLLLLRELKSMNVAKAARYAGVKPVTVRRWLEKGLLRGSKSGTKKQSRWIVKKRDLDAFLKRHTNMVRGT